MDPNNTVFIQPSGMGWSRIASLQLSTSTSHASHIAWRENALGFLITRAALCQAVQEQRSPAAAAAVQGPCAWQAEQKVSSVCRLLRAELECI